MRSSLFIGICALALAPGCDGCDDNETDGGGGQSTQSGTLSGPSTGQAGGETGSSSTGFNTTAGAGGGAGGGLCGTNLTGTIRDFQVAHPDFETFLGSDPGIVQNDLGVDQKPVYAGQAGNPTTTNQQNFDQWYRDVPGINQSTPFTIELVQAAGNIYTFESNAFFPIDGQLFGNEGNVHNYHFTFELHTKFLYQGGETFSFTGDDDLFTFINGKLAIDLGGVHGAQSQTIDLDQRAAELGMTPGNIYALDFFFAERHTSESNFRVDTSLSFVDCGEEPQ